MSFARTLIDVVPPFGPAVVKRSLPIDYIVEERSPTTGAWAPKDISSSRWSYKLRVWSSDDADDPLVGFDLTLSEGAATGQLRHDVPCGTTVRPVLAWEIVEIDNDTDDGSSRSGKVEVPKVRWHQPIIDAP